MKLDKRLVDEIIRTTKKYYRTGDTDMLSALIHAQDALKNSTKRNIFDQVELIEDLAMFTQHSGKGTYEDIYKALAVFGIEMEEIIGNINENKEEKK